MHPQTLTKQGSPGPEPRGACLPHLFKECQKDRQTSQSRSQRLLPWHPEPPATSSLTLHFWAILQLMRAALFKPVWRKDGLALESMLESDSMNHSTPGCAQQQCHTHTSGSCYCPNTPHSPQPLLPQALLETALTRVVLPMPILVLPPIVMSMLEK